MIRRDGRTQLVHRRAREEAYGEIPKGLHVLHLCDTPSCYAPEHLFLGTNYDNVQDRVRKNRSNHPKGERNPKAKLTEKDVLEIRADARVIKTVAEAYGVSFGTISKIKTRRTWEHV